MTAPLLDRYHELGIRGIATRSIGYDHIDVAHARELGIRVAHAAYPPEGVADYTIMLMLMALRRSSSSSATRRLRTSPSRARSAARSEAARWAWWARAPSAPA